MRGRAFWVLTLLSACARPGLPATVETGPNGPLSFRVLSERTVAHPCVDGVQFGVATDEKQWIDVFDMETSCLPDTTTVTLPDVDFDTEVAVAAWWGCPSVKVKTIAVARTPAGVVVTAATDPPASVCAPAGASTSAESFLAVRLSEIYDGSVPVRFVLDGRSAGTAKPGY
jgi:hypothetical protein